MARVQGSDGQWNTANLTGLSDGAAIRARIFRAFAIDSSSIDNYVLYRKEITSEGCGNVYYCLKFSLIRAFEHGFKSISRKK
jgi:hypothetical protein